jgi:RepB DNA-primase from phage plasmid
MLDSFVSVGVESFGLTKKMETGRVRSYQLMQADELFAALRKLVASADARRDSLIIRPFLNAETSSAIIQIDDLDANYDKFTPFSFCMTETSSGRYQAFLCVEDAKSKYNIVRRQLNTTANADRGATCAARLAGTLNNKTIRRLKDGTYPHVRLVQALSNRVVEMTQLVSAGLIGEANGTSYPKRTNGGFKYRNLHPPTANQPMRRLTHLPCYEVSLASVQIKDDGEPDRSAADLLFAITCLRWKPPIPREQIVELLMRHSEKAGERNDAQWYVDATIDEAMRRA